MPEKQPTLNRNRKMSLRLTEDEYDKLTHYSEKWAITKTELLLNSFEHYVRWVNSDYDLPTAEIARLNQLIDANNKLVINLTNLEKTTISGFSAIAGFNSGENYLMNDEKGEL